VNNSRSGNALTRFLGYLNWLVNPVHGLSTSQVYDLIGMASPTGNALYLNLGYWPAARDVDEASEALALLVAATGSMGAADTVLDCGFGFGDQDLLWAERCGPAKIIGLNTTASQVRVARQRVVDAGLAGRVDLREGSATRMPIDDASIDLVVALESAFHFDTREDFFAEAFRVLVPGGRLVTADIIPTPQAAGSIQRFRQRLSWYLVASRFNIPDENAYGIEAYERKLQLSGYEAMSVRSIREDVYAPLHEFLAANPAFLRRQHPLARLLARATLMRPAASVYAGLDYVIGYAAKPGAREGSTAE
jgi:ubiquinone/menaquinone biosynthesis C-methylase UbiE